MDDRQTDVIRHRLLIYRQRKGANGSARPWISVLIDILSSKATDNVYPEDGSEPNFKEEVLRRFSKGEQTPEYDKLMDIRAFLIEKKFLKESDLKDNAYGLEELLAVYGYLANQDDTAKETLKRMAGTYTARRDGKTISESTALELKLDSSGTYLFADETCEYKDESNAVDFRLSNQKRVGYGFVCTELNLLYLFLRGETKKDLITYVEIDNSSGYQLSLQRNGIEDIIDVQDKEISGASLHHIFRPKGDRPFEQRFVEYQGSGSLIFDDGDGDVKEIIADARTGKELIAAVKHLNAKKVAKLLGSGTNVNMQDEEGMTALHYAAAYGARPCVRLLVNSGLCDYSLKNNNGRTASELAFIWSRDYGVGRLLVKKECALGYSLQSNTASFDF